MTADTITAIKKALEGVTPGPWGYVASNENHGPYVCNDWGAGDICDGYVMSNPDSLSIRNGGDSKPINHQHDEADANMRYIAAVNPETISELITTLESLQRENEGLRERISTAEKCEWLPISQADKSIDRIYDYPGMPRPIGNSEEYWVRDKDGRVYQAAWADDGKRAYWWDLDGESPVDPVEFMPHPLSRTAISSTGDTHGN